jgi:Fic family protein
MKMMKTDRTTNIIEYIREHAGVSSSEIIAGLGLTISPATLRRDLARLVDENRLTVEGQNKGTRYFISPIGEMFASVDLDTYFEREIDQRKIRDGYNFELLDIMGNTPLFTASEYKKLSALQQRFRQNITKLTPAQYKKEMERLAVDLSWKSSQIEGNTYSLLETERLLMERETAQGKSLEEARMLLNHKEALDYVIESPHFLTPLSVASIENIHSILIQDLDVDRNIRTRRVGITGTNYRPLDNEFQIREALEGVCTLVNRRESIFDKALLILVLISYIQPFNDGNKRTARIVSNAELMANGHCPISFRTVDSIDYKKAMLLFYEQNNLSAFKRIFIDQFEFAVCTYF